MLQQILRRHWQPIFCVLISTFLLLDVIPYWLSSPQKKTAPKRQIQQAISHKSTAIPLDNYPLFGESSESNVQPIINTPLNLTLVGILNASDKKDSQALIKIDGAAEKIYFINDKINANTTLWRVLNNAVLLKRNGKIEKLSLPKTQLKTSKPPTKNIDDEDEYQ